MHSIRPSLPLRHRRLAAALVLLTAMASGPVGHTAGAAAQTAPPQAAPATRTLSLDLYLEMESVSGAQISPDATRIVYTRGWIDKVNDRRESSLWVMNADGSKARALVDGRGARWSPDGTRILYVAEGEPSGAQIFVRWMDAEGATTQITRLEHGPGSPIWSPDGRWIAFTSQVDDRPDFAGVKLPRRPRGAKWAAEPKIVERAQYKRDRRGYIDTGWTHVFVVPADGGTARRLTDGDWNHGQIAWSHDGREIYFTSYREEDWDRPRNWQESEIYAVEVETGRIRRLTNRRGPDGQPTPSPDGRWIAYVAGDEHRDTYRNQRIYVMRPDGSGVRLLSDGFDRQVGGLQWAPDGRGLYFNVSREGYRSLHYVSLEGGVTRLTEGPELFTLSSFAEDGTAVGTLATAHAPADLVRFRLDDPSTRTQLTHVNDDVLQGVTLGEVEEIWYDSDPFRVQGWIVKPPDFDPSRKYPLILAIHGGPHAMYNGAFNFAFQEHAANGYVVLYTNPRGSTGYGTDFANAIDHDYPGVDMQDLMRGVDEVVARGYIDEENLFVYGCSGGGILTSYIVGNTDRFRAASANCPIVNWISAMGTSDAITYARTFEKPFWEDTDEWIDRSSIFYVEHVTTPTMLMTGERDLRTPMGQTEEFYQALQYLGVPTVMIRFPDEWHGTTSRPSNFLRTQLYLRKWFEKWSSRQAQASPDAGR